MTSATTEIVFEIREDEIDGGYSASAREYGIHTQGETIAEVRDNVREAVECYFDDVGGPGRRGAEGEGGIGEGGGRGGGGSHSGLGGAGNFGGVRAAPMPLREQPLLIRPGE